MLNKKIFWKLPYTLRRISYKIFNYKDYKLNQELRKLPPQKNQLSLREFDNLKTIFVHIPKAGGISINNAYFKSLGGSHKAIKDYQLIYKKNEFYEYYKFAFVRNPWDRLVSAYFFLKEGGYNNKDKEWFLKNIAKYENFESFVTKWLNKKNIYTWIHFIPQYEFVCVNNRLSVNEIFKLEQIDKAILEINNKLHINVEIKHNNQTKARKHNYRIYYTEKTKNIVQNVYATDIELFNYEF